MSVGPEGATDLARNEPGDDKGQRKAIRREAMTGIGLVAAGFGANILTGIWTFLPHGVPTTAGFILSQEVLGGSSAAEGCLTAIGSLLTLVALAQILPEGRKWIVVGVWTALAGAVVLTSQELLYSFVAYPGIIPGGPANPLSLSLFSAGAYIIFAGGLASGLGFLLALYGVVQGILGRHETLRAAASS